MEINQDYIAELFKILSLTIPVLAVLLVLVAIADWWDRQ